MYVSSYTVNTRLIRVSNTHDIQLIRVRYACVMSVSGTVRCCFVVAAVFVVVAAVFVIAV